MRTVRGRGANTDVSPQPSSITYFLGEFGLAFMCNMGMMIRHHGDSADGENKQ